MFILKSLNRFYVLILISVVIRAAFFFAYEPIGYADSGWYARVAEEIVTLDFHNYDGARTPVYPLIIVLGGLKWKGVWLIQLAMGVVITLLLYRTAFILTKSERFAFWAGMSYNFSLILLFFESNLLTETTCILFLILSFYFFVRIVTNESGSKNIWNYFYLSIAVTLTGFTRPIFLYLFPLFLVFLFIKVSGKRLKFAALKKEIAVYCIPFLIIILGWSTFNKLKVDYFGPSTLTGFHLIEHSGAFIELAPDKYGDVRDIYLRYRSKQIYETGSQTCTIYPAYPEIQVVKNYSVAQVSKELTEISLWLFLHYPDLYLKSVVSAFTGFWYLPNFIDYWDLAKIRPYFLSGTAGTVLKAELIIWLFINAFFIGLFFLNVYQFFRIKRSTHLKVLFLLNFTVLILSVVQALMQYGDNWRFGICVKPLILLSILLNMYRLLKSKNGFNY